MSASPTPKRRARPQPAGECEIRTHARLSTSPVFKTGAINRSANSPPGASFYRRGAVSAPEALAGVVSQLHVGGAGVVARAEVDFEAARVHRAHAQEGAGKTLPREVAAGALETLDEHAGRDVAFQRRVVGLAQAAFL